MRVSGKGPPSFDDKEGHFLGKYAGGRICGSLSGHLSEVVFESLSLLLDKLAVEHLNLHHGDPFDRILAAHALALDIPILSIDPKLDTFGVRRIW